MKKITAWCLIFATIVSFGCASTPGERLVVVRYDNSGTLDTTFNDNGWRLVFNEAIEIIDSPVIDEHVFAANRPALTHPTPSVPFGFQALALRQDRPDLLEPREGWRETRPRGTWESCAETVPPEQSPA